MLKLANTFSPLELCDRGEYEAAAEIAGIRVGEWPENVSEGILTHAERLLVGGIITSTLGGIQQKGNQTVAKEMLTESIRLFGDDPQSLVAQFWLGWSEYWAGNLDKALATLNRVADSPVDERTRFRALLLTAGIHSERGFPEQAFAELEDLSSLYDGQDDLLKGKFHLERGRVLRQLKETDRAVIDYDCAINFLADNPRCQAVAANNLAGIYLETKQFPEAHRYAQRARELFEKLGDRTYEAKAWDQTALIFLAEGKLNEAELAINSGIALVNYGDILRECKETAENIKHAQTLKCEDENVKMRDTGTLPNFPRILNSPPREGDSVMTPLDSAMCLIENNPDITASALYDLLVWATSARDDPEHEVELDEIEEMLYSKTDDAVRHRKSYRGTRLLRSVTSTDS